MTSTKSNQNGDREAVVLRSADGRPREYLGVTFDVLATAERLMVTRMKYRAGMAAATHVHPHGQAGYVVSGRYRQTIAGSSYELGPGDSYVIPGGVEHSMEGLEGGEIIDVFTPIREEFRSGS
jgi:quercetin dioxygenase-like cupin family protein